LNVEHRTSNIDGAALYLLERSLVSFLIRSTVVLAAAGLDPES
jgi:hypothetical protein